MESGALDQELPGLRFVEFDFDEDKDELAQAGYASRMIPLFVVPDEDGTASQQRMSGSIKGPDSVEKNLLPRLKRLLAQSSH